jgi:hypothetical protein
MPSGRFPHGKRFAFSVIDDTDVATVDNVLPLYRLLERLEMRTTKTVWPLACPEGSKNFSSSQTLEDPAYLDFVLDLKARGFEIAWHGATMESSRRDRTLRGLERFRQVFGEYPRVIANHSYNRENLYWGGERVDNPVLRKLYGRLNGCAADHYLGHVPGSAYWWGDVCAERIVYARNLTFNDINLARINPTMPYRDPHRALVPWWFSGSDAEGMEEFNRLLHPRNQERLEREGGVCIVATHFGKGYVERGAVDAVTQERLEMLAGRAGWFPTVGDLLDWLRAQQRRSTLPWREWQQMQWRWGADLLQRKWQQRRARRQRRQRATPAWRRVGSQTASTPPTPTRTHA